MKKRLLIPLILLPALAAGEPIDPNPDGIGIYADTEGLVNQVDLEVGEAMEVYVVVTRPTGQRMFSGVEFTVVVPDNVLIWGWNTPMPGTFAFSDAPDFMMAWDPAEYQLACNVLTFIIVPLDSEPALFHLIALQHAAGGDAPRYLDVQWDPFIGDDLIDLTPYPGGQENASFAINGGIVPEDATSWSELKVLYR